MTLALCAGGILLVALVVANLVCFVWPSADTLQHADAVVVLAGGDGERLDRGLELVRAGVAPTLVASTGPAKLCDSSQPFEVICFMPSPETTRGEAEAIGHLAREHGWTRYGFDAAPGVVDIKETPDGIFVVEVNDNPNIEHGIEDAAEKDQVWVELTRWFIDRLEG